ncbi:MAG TPA: hypothetical protein VNZ49_04670 [Bacteroidia bacterium]|jgi:hypothetical protein|nr:hypothetical protein [Bacteroidia bacterium]
MNFTNMAKIHIGKKIKEIVDQFRYSITEFAGLINKSRTVAYDIFERDTLDTGLLQQISKVLNHNFFRYYNHDIQSLSKEEKSVYMSQLELIASLSEEIKSLRKQLTDVEKKYDLSGKSRKSTEGKLPYTKRKPKN